MLPGGSRKEDFWRQRGKTWRGCAQWRCKVSWGRRWCGISLSTWPNMHLQDSVGHEKRWCTDPSRSSHHSGKAQARRLGDAETLPRYRSRSLARSLVVISAQYGGSCSGRWTFETHFEQLKLKVNSALMLKLIKKHLDDFSSRNIDKLAKIVIFHYAM